MIKYTIKDYIDLLDNNNLLSEYNSYNQDNKSIELVTYNSKECVLDTLFVCKGASFKQTYLDEAIANGSSCYVSETKYNTNTTIPYIIVSDIRKAMALLGDRFYNSPWKELNLIGITGTKGKSTTAYYIKAIIDDYLSSQNKPSSAIMSSIDIYDGVINIESHITTPEAIELQMHFANAVKSNIEYMQMEVSSQALKYDRVDNITFDIGVFLNISEDHISPIEHPDFNDYFNSKLRIFKQCKIGIINLDSDFSDRVQNASKDAKKILTFSTTKNDADVYGYNIRKVNNEILFNVKTPSFDQEFKLTMPGLFNVENALASITIALALNIPVEFIQSGLLRARSSGRMELYTSNDKNIIAIVDYAHNKLSFNKLFDSTMKEYPDYDIVSIFGCPGKKAFVRRRDLGMIAGKYSKKVYLTAEDPGYEPVADISNDIAQYVKEQNCPYEMIEDRGEAIKAAIHNSIGKTVLLITGKGNETRQKYGSEYLDCRSDVEYVKQYLNEYNEFHQ